MKRQKWTILISAAMMLMLILDSQTALDGAKEGIEICIQTLIPSLFPFFVLSGLLTGSLAGIPFRWMKFVERGFRIPAGSGHLLILGFLAGYPVGAKNVADAYRNKQLTPADARRMTALCNNAGPAFLFGVLSSQFSGIHIILLLWLIQIVSVLLTANLIKEKNDTATSETGSAPVSPVQVMEQSLRAMASVCGWVILFRVLLSFLYQWSDPLFPSAWKVAITGLLELSNGCLMLQSIPSEGLRFSIASGLLAFGGCCVLMQTGSVCGKLSMKEYLLIKIMQSLLCYGLSLGLQLFFAPEDRITHPLFLLPILVLPILLQRVKKSSSIPVPFGV